MNQVDDCNDFGMKAMPLEGPVAPRLLDFELK
jgi:hypothetical protein